MAVTQPSGTRAWGGEVHMCKRGLRDTAGPGEEGGRAGGKMPCGTNRRKPGRAAVGLSR